MPPLLIQAPQEGINTTLPDTLISPREAGRRSQNIIYENGYLTTPEGFAAVDIVTGLDKEHGSLSVNSNVLNIFSSLMADLIMYRDGQVDLRLTLLTL